MNFTGVSAMGAVDRPMGIVSPVKLKRKKDKRTVVREAALRVVSRLLDGREEHSDEKHS